ncbi:MAG TPA: tetratricopeptide repeat protein [Terracidiphilus sp.]|nr:tetratricopeptide repeat protein [Terracidiphilus sp.]
MASCLSATARSQAPRPAGGPIQAGLNPQTELEKRIELANAAQVSGNPEAIAAANKRLLAFGIRLMGQLRVSEGAYPQAAELYRASMNFEDSPGIHADLAMTSQLARNEDEAIQQSKLALAENPADAQVEIMLGRAYLAKKEYGEADKALTKAARLNPDVKNFYLLAVTWLQSERPDGRKRADLVFAQMKSAAGDSGSLHVLIGRAYRDAGLMPDAVKEFRRAIELDPATPHAHTFLGLALYATNEWQPTPQATEQMQKELQYHPEDFLANYLLGVIKSSEHQYAEADKYLKVAAALNPTWPELYLYMGLDAFAEHDDKTAETMLRKAVDLTGNDEARTNYQIRRAYVDLGRILARSGREKEADVFIGKARNLENKLMHGTQQNATAMMLAAGATSSSLGGYVPLKTPDDRTEPTANANDDAAARLDLGTLASSSLTPAQREKAQAEEDTLRPILGESYSHLATAEAIQKQYPVALKHYEAAEQWDPGISDLEKNLGQAAFRAENYPEAVRALSLAVKQNPNSTPLRAMLGMAYFQMQRYGDAANAFYPLGDAGIHDPAVGYAWAFSLSKTGDLKDASQVLALYQAGPLSKDGQLLVGQLWIEIGDYDRATAILQQLLASDPSFPKAHYNIALADIHAGKWTEARAELNAELAISPNDPDTLFNVGYVDIQESKNSDAIKIFQQVIAAHPDYANAQYQLGKLLLDSGKVQDALPHLEAAARHAPDKAYVHYQLQAAYRRLARTADADRELALYEQIKTNSRAESRAAVNQELQQKP